MRKFDKIKNISEINSRLNEEHIGIKPHMMLNIRLRTDSHSSKPSYSEQEVLAKLLKNEVLFNTNENGTIFLLDKNKNNKIIGVIESNN